MIVFKEIRWDNFLSRTSNPCKELTLENSERCWIELPDEKETPEQSYDRAMRGI